MNLPDVGLKSTSRRSRQAHCITLTLPRDHEHISTALCCTETAMTSSWQSDNYYKPHFQTHDFSRFDLKSAAWPQRVTRGTAKLCPAVPAYCCCMNPQSHFSVSLLLSRNSPLKPVVFQWDHSHLSILLTGTHTHTENSTCSGWIYMFSNRFNNCTN